MQPVVYLVQFCACYCRDHFLADYRVLQYLCTVNDRKRTFRGRHKSPLSAGQARLMLYSDSDWVMGSTDRKSYFGNVVHLNGGLAAWYTLKQPIVTWSCIEGEYVALSDACKGELSL